jgi:hypothetical protein
MACLLAAVAAERKVCIVPPARREQLTIARDQPAEGIRARPDGVIGWHRNLDYRREDVRYCSAACRQRAYRGRKAAVKPRKAHQRIIRERLAASGGAMHCKD